MRSIWAAGLLLRRIRTELGIVLLIVGLVGSTSLVFAAAPRLLARASDDALRHALTVALPQQRNVVLVTSGQIGPGEAGGVEGLREQGAAYAEEFPPTIAALVAERTMGVSTIRLAVDDAPIYPTYLTLRYQEGVTEASRLVEGRWPVDLGMPLRQNPVVGSPIQPGEPPDVFEMALSAATAKELGFALGDRLVVALDGSDALIRGQPFRLAPTEVVIVGLFEANDPGGEYWFGDTTMLKATIAGGDEPVAYAVGAIAPETYPNLFASGLPFRYEWRYRIDPARMEGTQVEQVQSELRRLGQLGGNATTAAVGGITILTGLSTILDRYATERALTESILSVAAIGPFGLAAGAIGMVAILLVRRRRAAILLARGRGASSGVVLGTQLWEAALVAGAAALLGLVAALVLVPARAGQQSVVLAVGVAVVSTLLLVGASWSAARKPLGQLERDDAPVLRVAPRRLVLEGTIVGVAVGAALLLRQRGLTLGDAPGGDGLTRVDPLLASVPVLSGLAAGIVVARLYPVPIRVLGWLAARRRDLVPVLGLRTIGRHPAVANLPLLALMLTAAFGSFASVIAATLDRGQVSASYLEVGSDFRVERIGGNSLALVDPASVAGVEAVAPGLVDSSAAFASTLRQRASIHLVAIDPTAYDQVTAGTAADPRWPGAFYDDPGAEPGTDANPIPLLLSTKLPPGTTALGQGSIVRMSVVGRQLTFRLAEQRDTFAGIDQRVAFAVVPFTWIRAAIPDAPPPPSNYWLRAPREAAGGLAEMVARASGAAAIVSRYGTYAKLHDAPFSIAIVTGFALAVVIAAIYMAFTIIGALILSSARRTQDLAYLRTLGVTGVQALLLTVMEHAPPVILALLPGVALGIGIAVLTEGGLGLASFVGTDRAVPLYVDVPALGIVVAGLIAIVVVAVAAGTWLSRRVGLVNALRIGEH